MLKEGVFVSHKSVSIRIEKEMLNKISYIAEYEGRSVNSHMLVLAREDIRIFEEKHGKIEFNLSSEFNVKPKK